MNRKPVLLALLLAFALAAGALAATAAVDPKTVALRTADLPANARLDYAHASDSTPLPGGQQGRAYATTYTFPRGRRVEVVNAILLSATDTDHARAIYKGAVADSRAENAQLQHRALALPAFGDQQYAVLLGDVGAQETQVQLWVRRNTVVWKLSIFTDPTAVESGLSKAESLAELRRYATRLKARVGNG